jgi:putative FmdB family regulatory protein
VFTAAPFSQRDRDRAEEPMPIYEYACPDCGHRFDAMQKFSDDPIRDCPSCKAQNVKKLISATSFVLKGGGWYKDHYGLKSGGSSDAGGGSSSGGSSSGGSSSGGSSSGGGSDAGASGSSGGAASTPSASTSTASS